MDVEELIELVSENADTREQFQQLCELARFAAALKSKVPIYGAVSRIDPVNWAIYETGRDMEDGTSIDILSL